MARRVIRHHSRNKGRNHKEESMDMSRRNVLAAGGSTAIIAMAGSASSSLAQSAASQTSLDLRTTSDSLGINARQAMIDIFRKKDRTVVDRYFAEPFIQHDPNLGDGLAGMKSFAAEVTSSPTANITIYRVLVDGDFVLLHSRYEGVGRYAGPAIAFDLFRFKDDKIVEHWGGQEPGASPNMSGRTQVDGPTKVLDREKTEANRTLVRTYRETVMVSLRFDRIEEFIEGARYAQHASKIGDGIAQVEGPNCKRGKGRRTTASHTPSLLGRGQLCTCAVGRRSPVGADRALRSVSGRKWQNSRALGRLGADTSTG